MASRWRSARTGIYAEGRLPLERLKQGTPVLAPECDVYTNHIHADDLARAAVAALFRAKPNRAYNVTDDAELRMGGWFDAVADAFRLPRPPRVTWEEAEARIAPSLLSFMNESRRLSNARMKRECASPDLAGAAGAAGGNARPTGTQAVELRGERSAT